MRVCGRIAPPRPGTVPVPIWGLLRRPPTSSIGQVKEIRGHAIPVRGSGQPPRIQERYDHLLLRCNVMDDPERRPSASELLRDQEKAENKAVSLMLMSALTLTMTAWVVFLGWAAWSVLGDG